MFRIVLSFALVALAAAAEPVVDDSPTRVESTLETGLECIGTLRPKAVGEVKSSRWTLDCAGTDREHADWRAVRDYVAPLGIARIRVQAGWARTEKDPGVYDFAWLDQIVFDAARRGIEVWMELSYGNPAYPGGGGRQLAGGMPSSEEALSAWDRWVGLTAKRYAGVVRDWCVWNEPDLRVGGVTNSPERAAAFAIRTAEIVRREIPDATIAAFALSWANAGFVRPLLAELKARGKTGLFDTIAYHHYKANPDDGYDEVEACRRVVAEYAPNLRLREGEGGTLSEWCAVGALSRLPWTELKQAKYDLRRALGDLGHGDDTSVFHICDLEYRTSGFHDGLVRYGLLKTTGQAEGFRVLKVKKAYYAVQNAVSVFNDALEAEVGKGTSTLSGVARPAVYDWRDRSTGLKVAVFWDAAAMPKEECAAVRAELRMRAEPFAAPVWVDVLTGNAYRLPPERIRREGDFTVYAVPCYDSPAFVADRSLLALDESWEVRSRRR